MARLIVALSGGVDSAVAAARAVEAGHEVVAVHFALHGRVTPQSLGQPAAGTGDSTLPSPALGDSRRVADALGLPFEVWDLSEQFEREVVDDFLAEYAAGRTPNPCLRCNRTIKFGAALDRALARGFDGVVTGHYARLVSRRDEESGQRRACHLAGGSGVVELRRARDLAKDQSYVLAVLSQHQLGHCWFPLGDTLKSEVRAEAAARGLPVARRPDSTDICFIPDGDAGGWLRQALGDRPGPIVDESGQAIGRHRGTFTFTIGQRRGLGLRRPAVDGQPRYVVGLDPIRQTVTVGPKERLRVTGLVAGRPTWTDGAAPPAVDSADGWAVLVQFRAHGQPQPASLRRSVDPGQPPALSQALLAEFTEPVWGVAPGQTAVFYDGDRVVGSALIEATRR